jgi:hypothetical protein
MEAHDPAPTPDPPQSGLVVLFGVLAGVGTVATLFLGIEMLSTQLQPETHKVQAIVRVVQVVVLPFIGMAACLGVGAGLGGLAVVTGRARLWFVGAISLTLVGLGCAVAALR